jgi:3-oxoacyl-[acyl-carrier protein] reductase
MKDLSNKTALVTGASRGIGRAIALKFAEAGARVIVNYAHNREEAETSIALMGENKNKASIVKFDVSDQTQVFEAITALSPIDILINNAGISIDNLLLRLKNEDFDKEIGIKLKGPILCAKACIPTMMKNRWGRIINISSVVGEMGNAGQSVYAASKAGLIGMTKSLSKELASRNILVNAITPGYIETDMTKDINEEAKQAILGRIPLKRIGKPEDIANAALFLASSDADYITGHVLSVNGGLYM